MAERTVIAPWFAWFDASGDLQTAFRGALVDVPDADAARGDAIGAFLETRADTPAYYEDVTPAPVAEFTEEEPAAPKRRRQTPARKAQG